MTAANGPATAKRAGALIVSLLLLFSFPLSLSAQEEQDPIASAATRWGVSPAFMRCVALRESGLNPLAYNKYDGSSGLFQFQPRTWTWASWQAGYGGASVWDAEANANAAAWLMSQPGGIWHWSVTRACL